MTIGEMFKEAAKAVNMAGVPEEAPVVFYDGVKASSVLRVDVFETIETDKLAPLELAAVGGDWIEDELKGISWRPFKPLTMTKKADSTLTVALRNP